MSSPFIEPSLPTNNHNYPRSAHQEPYTGKMLVALFKDRRQKKTLRQESLAQMRLYLERNHIDFLIRFASQHGGLPNVIFFREMNNWKSTWEEPLLRKWKQTHTRQQAFKHAALIYFLLVDDQHSRMQVTLPSSFRADLVDMFSGLRFTPGQSLEMLREQTNHRSTWNLYQAPERQSTSVDRRTPKRRSDTDKEHVEPNIDDIEFTLTPNSQHKMHRVLNGSLPGFNIGMFDKTLEAVANSLVKTLWPAFVDAMGDNLSVTTESTDRTAAMDRNASARSIALSHLAGPGSRKDEAATSAAALSSMMPMM